MDEDFLRDILASVGPISVKRMFGGQGIYGDHGIFAVVVDGQLYLKGDEATLPDYEQAGMVRWTYQNPKNGRQSSMPYWRVPEEALDSAEAMAPLARLAIETAVRAEAAKRR